MIVNRTGAGFHRDSRKEARMSRRAELLWALSEQEWHWCDDWCNVDCVEEPTLPFVGPLRSRSS